MILQFQGRRDSRSHLHVSAGGGEDQTAVLQLRVRPELDAAAERV